MKKKRLIPILLLRNGYLVQSKGFFHYQNLGNPITATKRLSEWASDELMFLDISQDDIYDMNRDDQGYPNRHSFEEIIKDIAKVTFMPITIGGKIRTLKDIEKYLKLGADKISINTQAIKDRSIIKKASQEFGSQCIVVSIDVKKIEDKYFVVYDNAKKITKFNPLEWAKIVEAEGAGEILLNSVDRDGMQNAYDIELLKIVADNIKIPVIACGGVGKWEDFAEAFDKTNVDAVAAANIFQYTDQSVYYAKKYLYEKGYNVRPPDLLDI